MPAVIIAAPSEGGKEEIRHVDISRTDRNRAAAMQAAIGSEFLDYAWVVDPNGREFLIYHTQLHRIKEAQQLNALASLIAGYSVYGNALVYPPNRCG